MFFIDTNIFLEYLLQRQKWEQCEILFKKIESGEITAITSGFCVHTIELLKEFLTYLISLEKLFVYHTLLVDEIRIISEMEKNNLEFEDALQYFVAKQFKCKAIISFDRHFDGLQIPRKTPAELA